MIIIPAIDIKNGLCVRLKQGQMSKETVYSQAPHEIAVKWYEKGAERLHIVDLDGAIQGRPINSEVIRSIVHAIPIPIQLGGGIRDIQTIETYLELGIHQIILGTVAYKDPEFVSLACKRFPEKIIIGIDAKRGQVSVEGWTQETDMTPEGLAKKYEGMGISAIVYTDILRDGMSTGPNVKATKDLAKAINVPVIASGGISGMDDVKKILPLSKYGVMGMITGRALYEGTLDLAEAVELLKKHEKEFYS